MSFINKIGSAFGGAFRSVSILVTSTADSLDMLDRYVQQAKKDQLARQAFHRQDFVTRTRLEYQASSAKFTHELRTKLEDDPKLAAEFLSLDDAYNAVEAELRKELKSLNR